MSATTKIIGKTPFVQLLAASIKSQYARYEQLKKLGGFTLNDVAQESGLTRNQCEPRVNALKLQSELVILPGKNSKTRVYLPAGVKLPK